MQKINDTTRIKNIILSILGISLLSGILFYLVGRWKQRQAVNAAFRTQFKPTEQGLSEAEAVERRTDERAQARLEAELREKQARRKRNIFSVFNLTILVLAVSQLLMRDYWGSVGTLATLLFNISVNIFQESRAARRVSELAEKARPLANVIREGRLRSIHQDEIVVGDVLVAGHSDEILANGTLLESKNLTIEETVQEAELQVVPKKPGDSLTMGTFCRSGWAVYRVEQVPIETGGEQQAAGSSAPTMTALQDIVQKVLYVLLAIAGLFYITLLLEIIRVDILSPETLAAYRNVLSLIFSIAPGGLFFMIVVNYAVGSADIARSGVLVRNNLDIESLANVTTLCLVRRGGVLGVTTQIEAIPPGEGREALSENRIRQVLGDYAHSISDTRFPMSVLSDTLAGERQPIAEQARYLSLYGWEAVNFETRALPGSYVIGVPEILEAFLIQENGGDKNREKAPVDQTRTGKIKSRLGKLFRRKPSENQEEKAEELATVEPESELQKTSENDNEVKSNGFGQRFQQRIKKLIRRRATDDSQDPQAGKETRPDEILRLMLAYSPQSQPLYDESGQPRCPGDLIPAGFIHFKEQIRPDVQKAVNMFMDAGVDIKVLSEDAPMNTLAIAQQVGLVNNETEEGQVFSGKELVALAPDIQALTIHQKALFASLNIEEMGHILDVLRDQGEYVGLVAGSGNDLPLLGKANLKITNQSSGPELLNQADIIIMKNSPDAFPGVLQQGQRIVNGLMNVLKLNLTQIFYILILLVAMFFSGDRAFYYQPAQGGAIAIFTIAIPSIGLSLWASTAAVNRSNMHQQLAYFVAPAAMMIALFVVLFRYLTISGFTSFTLEYSQLVITHFLVIAGLWVVVFAKPPLRGFSLKEDFKADWRPTYLVIALFLIFQFATQLSLAQRFLSIAPLVSARDYLFVWGMSIAWAGMTLGIWRIPLLRRGLDWGSKWMAAPAK